MNIEEPASIKPRSKLSIAVEKAAAQLEASKKEKQRETAARCFVSYLGVRIIRSG
jgi:MinD-like ATPase involved in chromosome partitioning or flagellar assembly